MKETQIISGFPGVGKSYFVNNLGELFSVFDSDSSSFSWLETEEGKVRNPEFPQNYIEHIQSLIGIADIVFVSSHDNVRALLKESNIPYTLVYPSLAIKEEYIERYRKRGNEEGFVKLLEEQYENFIGQIERETFPELIQLETGQYLADVLK